MRHRRSGQPPQFLPLPYTHEVTTTFLDLSGLKASEVRSIELHREPTVRFGTVFKLAAFVLPNLNIEQVIIPAGDMPSKDDLIMAVEALAMDARQSLGVNRKRANGRQRAS